ncbi:hypothetical protein BJ138DRAFT_1123089 [Hygrophoropsis aurantiaca]|uniref:Uncharacterized protein n=1 Tax=Hygrophoropsis aurantiaca TaxID=72124 RepID=A0ACB8ANN0_9AGAM|nr:hypothetical protein BJ138DRAFT_1123089 [Hygrophoropsis aurantiaca]
MNGRNPNQMIVPSENWDDDFEFHQNNERNVDSRVRPETIEPRLSVTSTQFSEDWDSELPPSQPSTIHSVLGDRKNYPAPGFRNALEEWAEPGPSTPTKRLGIQTENWDDDFEDKTDSPARRPIHPLKTRHSYHTPPRPRANVEHENWDDDFEMEKHDTPMGKRTRHDAYAESSDEEGEFGSTDKEEDKTVTARSRAALMLKQSPPPPVPALPQSLLSPVEPFPRSPAGSVFSIPTTSGGRNSLGYNSTSHLALRPTLSGGSLAMLPPSPPIHRERRRLRKKSRPPHLDNNVFELVEEQYEPAPLPPSTPERPSSPPLPSSDATSPGTSKAPLLSRIGSVKKWGVRKKRASTGPSEVLAHEYGYNPDIDSTPRPPSSLAQSPQSGGKSGWFFRNGGGPGPGSPPTHAAELKHEKSFDKVRLMSSNAPPSPSKLSRRQPSRSFDPNSSSEFTESSSKPSLVSAARRPTSMQVPNGRFPSSGARAASYGSSVGRSMSKNFSLPTESVEEFDNIPPPPEGSRSFMGSVRKISLVGQKKHKKKKSSADIIPLPELPPTLPDVPITEQLLPPIELQPPSPPRVQHGIATSYSAPISISAGIEPLILPSSSLPVSMSPRPSLSSRNTPAKPVSPQSASLGRTTQVPNQAASNVSVPRRNSLGDLKIPARISQAQIGLKRDLGMVREFAASVDKLKELRSTYHALISEVQTILESAPPSRATSPTILHLTRPRSRSRSNTIPPPIVHDHKRLASTFYAISSKYKISWECAELLIELGGGTPAQTSPPSSSVSAPTMQAEIDHRKNRERAVTLSGEESKPPPAFSSSSLANQSNLAWRASTGRNDLSQRQLVLLRDMLSNPDGSTPDDLPIPEDIAVNRHWRWGDAMSSTVTLPSEESTQASSERKKRRGTRLGMSGLRDMLRSLKRNYSEQPPPLPSSIASLSTESSIGSQSHHQYPHPQVPQGRRRSKTSIGPDSVRSTREQPANSPYVATSLTHKASPRRPSLASIFRIGQKNKASTSGHESSKDSVNDMRAASRGSSRAEEEDWDQIDAFADLDGAAKALGIDGSATIKGKKSRSPFLPAAEHAPRPVTPKRTPNPSQTSLVCEPSPRSIRPMRSTRLSNVEEIDDDYRQPRSKLKAEKRISLPRTSPQRPPSRSHRGGGLTGSVRSAPPPQSLDNDSYLLPEFKLAMTPENIKPLLENAKEVHLRLNECIREVRSLLDTNNSS